jgi:hypothetical protein
MAWHLVKHLHLSPYLIMLKISFGNVTLDSVDVTRNESAFMSLFRVSRL